MDESCPQVSGPTWKRRPYGVSLRSLWKQLSLDAPLGVEDGAEAVMEMDHTCLWHSAPQQRQAEHLPSAAGVAETLRGQQLLGRW